MNNETDAGLVICDITARKQDTSTRFVTRGQLEETAALFPELEPAADPVKFWLELSPGAVRITRRSSIPSQQKRPESEHKTAITEWSSKSRANMVKRLCTLDYQPMLGNPERTPGLITLTYPGNWQAVVPDGQTAKRHLKTFRARYQREWGEPLRAVWKMEFQRRGAVHFHLFTSLPHVPSFATWLSETWTDIVDAHDPQERERHLAAGTGIDFNAGARGTDPKRIAVYFTKHNSPNRGSKEHQNQPPAEWIKAGKVGRFWGYWNLQPVTVEVEICQHAAIQAARTLRRWSRANNKPTRRRVARTNRRTGVVRFRWVNRRGAPRMVSMAGFISVNDGSLIGRSLANQLNVTRRS